jgi:carbonic anhydrase/acetyltransferase-like protein (isoleucine patch superfamily)
MLIEHLGKAPEVHPSAYVAPNAVLCGDVRIGPSCRVMFGAQLIAEGGCISVGEQTIVLENAVVRSTEDHSLEIGSYCLVGPHAHLVGCALEDGVFIATGACVFHAARVGRGAEVRINAVVHLKTELPAGAVVPIGWVAVGRPAQVLPPSEHDRIWALQEPLDFPATAYGVPRGEASMQKLTAVSSRRLASHRDDVLLEGAATRRK